MNNLARVALLAIGAMAAKKYMNKQQPYGTDLQTGAGGAQGAGGTWTGSGTASQGAAADQELLDASGRPIHPGSARSPLRSLKDNPNVSWIADPQLRAKNLDRLKEVWSQRHQR